MELFIKKTQYGDGHAEYELYEKVVRRSFFGRETVRMAPFMEPFMHRSEVHKWKGYGTWADKQWKRHFTYWSLSEAKARKAHYENGPVDCMGHILEPCTVDEGCWYYDPTSGKTVDDYPSALSHIEYGIIGTLAACMDRIREMDRASAACTIVSEEFLDGK